MTNIIIYDSSRLQSVLSALSQLDKYPDARLKDTIGMSASDITSWVATLDTNTALVTYQERILVDVGEAFAAATAATDDIVFTTNPSTGEVFSIMFGSLVLATFTVGATETLAALVDGLEAGAVAGTGWSIVSDNTDTISVTANQDLGASANGYAVHVVSDTATTTNDGPAELASGVDGVGVVGDLTATHVTALDALLATNPAEYDGDTTATVIAATATKNQVLIAWEDLWTNPAPQIIHYLGGYQVPAETRASMALTITAHGDDGTKVITVGDGGAGIELCSVVYGTAPASVEALAIALQQDIMDNVATHKCTVERSGAVLIIYPPEGQDVLYTDTPYTLGVSDFTATEDGDPFTGGTANLKINQCQRYAETYLNDVTDDIMVIWKQITNWSQNLTVVPSDYPPIQNNEKWLELLEIGEYIQDYVDL